MIASRDAVINFDHRFVFFDNRFLEHVLNAVASGAINAALHRVAALHHGPFLIQEKIGPSHRGVPWQAVALGEGLAQRDSHFAINAREIPERCDDTGTAYVAGLKKLGGLAGPGAAAFGVDARFLPGDPARWRRMEHPRREGG